jgi:hypothetical protein
MLAKLKERDIILDPATAIDETTRNAIETAQTVNVISKEAREAAPETSAAVAAASETAKERARIAVEKTKEAVRETTEKAKRKLKKGEK